MSSFYGGGRIANATVRVTPDTRDFQAQLQAAVDRAFANLKVPPVGAGGAGGVGGVSKGIKEASTASNALRGALIGLSRVTPVTVFGLGLYGTAGIAAGLAIQNVIKSTAQFEQQLNTLQAVTGVTDEQLQGIRETAIALGGDASLAAISAKDAADALTELAKAGLTVKDSLAAVRGVLELAGASGLSAGAAAKFVATELNAFKLAGDQAQRVVDLLASASIAAQGEIEDFGNAFQQVSAVAAQAGLSVEQTTAALTQLAKAGITSSDAGTSLRTFLLRLIPTTKQAGAFVKALGVTLDESKSEGEQLTDIIGQYRSALLALGPVQRTAVLNQIFGQDAVRAASVLLTQNSGALKQQIDDLDNAGVAAALNAAKAKGLAGAYAGLKSTLETVGIEIGASIDGPLEGLLRGMTNTIIKAERAAKQVDDLATSIGKIRDVEASVDVIVTVYDKTPESVKTGFKEFLKFAAFGPTPIGSNLLALDALNALTGGGGPETGPAVPTLGKKAKKIQSQFSIDAFLPNLNTDIELDKGFAKAAATAAKKNRELRARVAAELRKQGGGGVDEEDFGGLPPRLKIDQLNAQISGSLQAELEVDKRIRKYYETLVKLTDKKSADYVTALSQLQAADAAVEAIQKQINDEALARQKKQEDLLKQRREDAAKLAKSRIDLQNEVLDTRLGKAQLTETTADDLKVYKAQIKLVEADIARQKKIAGNLKKSAQVRIDALLQVQTDLQKINNIKAAIKSLKDKDKSGATPEDFFRAAIENFRAFGGGSGIISAQDVRGDVAGRALKLGLIGRGGKASPTPAGQPDSQRDRDSNARTRTSRTILEENRRQTQLLAVLAKGYAKYGRPVRDAQQTTNTRSR